VHYLKFFMAQPVSIVTVNFDSLFYIRLLVEKVREHIGAREYEIVVVDRGSRDGSREWLREQKDVNLVLKRQWRQNRHSHGEAAELGVQTARHGVIILMDSDAHPCEPTWLEKTADRLDDHYRLAGAQFHTPRRDNPHGWYIHPHFMTFFKADLGSLITLRKTKGRDTDTGEDSTVRLLEKGLGILAYPMEFQDQFSVGNPSVPTVSAGVFHAWYSTRLSKNNREVHQETRFGITQENYAEPLKALLRNRYSLPY
jgi:glycosyltransferase involved in cell wall biosynthesis